jgi:hypothetical protein
MEAASSSETMVPEITVRCIAIWKSLAVWRLFLKYLYVSNRYEPIVGSVPNNGASLRLQYMELYTFQQIRELENFCSAFFTVCFGIIRSLVTRQFYIYQYVLCFYTYLGSYDFECCHQLEKCINRMSVTNAPVIFMMRQPRCVVNNIGINEDIVVKQNSKHNSTYTIPRDLALHTPPHPNNITHID